MDSYSSLLLTTCMHAWLGVIPFDNEIFSADRSFPGIIFWGPPIEKCITPQGATIQSPDTGISLSIPEQALSSTKEDVDLLIHPCFNGPFELPAGYESASPAYLIQPSRRVTFQKDTTLSIHHYTSLRSEEECEEMVFLSASPAPQYRHSKPVYIFKEIIQSKGTFTPNSHIGKVALKSFCIIGAARKREHHSEVDEPSPSKSKITTSMHTPVLIITV